MQEKLFVQSFFFFFQSKIANSFYSKINDSIGVRTTGFWSDESGFQSLSCQIFLWFQWLLSETPIFCNGTVGRTMRFWSGRYGSEMQLFPAFLNSIVTTENRDVLPPSYPKTFSLPEIFWNTERFLYEKFRYWGTKKVLTQIRDTPPPLMHENFRYYNFSQTQKGVHQWNFLALWDKKSSAENYDQILA